PQRPAFSPSVLAVAAAIRRGAAVALAAQSRCAAASAQQYRRAPAAALADHASGSAAPAPGPPGLRPADARCPGGGGSDLATGPAGLSAESGAADHRYRPFTLDGRQ